MEHHGFKRLGSGCEIDERAQFLNPSLVTIGDNVRIDADAFFAGRHPIVIGDHVHVASGARLFSSGGSITLADFAGLSANVLVFTASDDYVGGALTNPTVPAAYRNVTEGPVSLEKHALVGAGSVLLPNVTLGFGSAVGALSLVRRSVEAGLVVSGNPARTIATRDIARLAELEAQLRRV